MADSGIAPEDLPGIFEEFYWPENAKAVERQGTRLAIVKEIV